ncbi:MAG: hypothetical protein ACYCZK_03580 [Microbacteriaceae bacterium]
MMTAAGTCSTTRTAGPEPDTRTLAGEHARLLRVEATVTLDEAAVLRPNSRLFAGARVNVDALPELN